MISTCTTVAFQGIQILPVEVQIHLSSQHSNQHAIVGLPDKSIRESYERIRSAFASSGLIFPYEHITINLSPASLHKEGSHYDLAISLGLLVCMRVLPSETLRDRIIIGELSLNGSIIPVPGVFAASLYAKEQRKTLICPFGNAQEAVDSGLTPIIAAQTLLELIHYLKNIDALAPLPLPQKDNVHFQTDMADVRGQSQAKRALEIAAAGVHNLLFKGPPGSGKSMLASRLPSILPPLNEKELHEINLIASISGQLKDHRLIRHHPYRTPHHSCSMAAMVGGGKNAKPGEITLAHYGVLFLDELPEFPKQVLESLRQPIESGYITISRAQAHVTYPSSFQLIAAMNPCPCGYLGDMEKSCGRAPTCGERYLSKLSGPILDRIDMHIDVPELPLKDLQKMSVGETSAVIRQRVIAARELQSSRYQSQSLTNSSAPAALIESTLSPHSDVRSFLDLALDRWKLSMRGYTRIMRVARTIADLDQQEYIERAHLAEAFSYRPHTKNGQ